MSELELHDPFQLPDPYDEEPQRPRWWYAQQLRMAGASWEEVAHSLGYSSAESARMTVKNSRRDRSKDTESLEDFVDLELQRLDMLQLICWKDIKDETKDRYKAISSILAIMQLRMRLLGTEKKPETGATQQNNSVVFIGGNQQDFITGLQKIRDMNKKTIEASNGNQADAG